MGGGDLRFFSPQPDTSLNHGDHDVRYGTSVLHVVPVHSPDFAGTHCTFPWRDGLAELTWAAGYIPRRFTSLIKTNVSPLSQTDTITTNAVT